jgi:hypothetical protein
MDVFFLPAATNLDCFLQTWFFYVTLLNKPIWTSTKRFSLKKKCIFFWQFLKSIVPQSACYHHALSLHLFFYSCLPSQLP